MATRTPPVLKVPAVTVDKIARGVTVALFLRGTEAFADARGQVKIEDTDGKQVDAKVITATVGRFFAMCSQYMSMSVYNQPAGTQGSTAAYLGGAIAPSTTTGIQASDSALFDALDDGSPNVLHPLEPYTVVLAIVAPDPAPTVSATPGQVTMAPAA